MLEQISVRDHVVEPTIDSVLFIFTASSVFREKTQI
jgi:hypothetical protein